MALSRPAHGHALRFSSTFTCMRGTTVEQTCQKAYGWAAHGLSSGHALVATSWFSIGHSLILTIHPMMMWCCCCDAVLWLLLQAFHTGCDWLGGNKTSWQQDGLPMMCISSMRFFCHVWKVLYLPALLPLWSGVQLFVDRVTVTMVTFHHGC